MPLPSRIKVALLFLLAIIACRESTLPVIHLYTQTPQLTGRNKEKGLLRYSDGQEELQIAATINRRGGMSFIFPKHSYTLQLDQKIPLGFLPMDDDWILNASYIDKTFLRHKISYDLFRRMGKNNLAPHCSYLHVYFNDRYQGLYILMEKLDVSTLYLDKKDPLAVIFKDPPIFTPDSLTIVPDSSNFYEQKYPQLTEVDKNGEMHRLKDFLFHAPDEDFRKQLGFYFDLDNILDWHLLLLFTNNSDGILKNFYLYKQNANTPFRIAIWDYDHSFGRDGDNELNLIRPLNPQRSILLKRLMELNAGNYSCRLARRWQALNKADILSARQVRQLMEANGALIEEDLPRNAARWPMNSSWYFDDNDYEEEVEVIQKYLDLRIPQLDAYFQDLALEYCQ